MVKTISLDTLTLAGTNIWVDLGKGTVSLEVHYTVSAADGSFSIAKTRHFEAPVKAPAKDIFSAAEIAAIVNLARKVKAALEAEELT